MVKAASQKGHGLDRKYKPWRRGQSAKQRKDGTAKPKPKGSLKHQLRGFQRLLPKAKDEAHRESILQQIATLQEQIEDQNRVAHQTSHARRSHGVRFLERQRLTRLWQQAAHKHSDRDNNNSDDVDEGTKEKLSPEQYRIGLDMLYVAHYYPLLDGRYQPLFRQGERILLDGRNLARRAAARGKILRHIYGASGGANSAGRDHPNQAVPPVQRAAWIPPSVYQHCPTDTWSNQLERSTFGVVAPAPPRTQTDDRFAMPAEESALALAAQKVDAALDAEVEQEVPSDASHEDNLHDRSSSTSNIHSNQNNYSAPGRAVVSRNEDDKDGPLRAAVDDITKGAVGGAKDETAAEASDSSGDDSSSDDDSSSSSSTSSSSGSSSTTSSSSDEEGDSNEKKKGRNGDAKPVTSERSQAAALPPPPLKDDDNDDDFLVEASDEEKDSPSSSMARDIFANAREHSTGCGRRPRRQEPGVGYATATARAVSEAATAALVVILVRMHMLGRHHLPYMISRALSM
jgi:hypothetical protein